MDRDPLCPNFLPRDMKELCLKYRVVVCPKSEPIRQMVLGTDNQEKEPSREGSPPMAPALKTIPTEIKTIQDYVCYSKCIVHLAFSHLRAPEQSEIV